MGMIDSRYRMKVYVTLRYTIDFIGSTWINHSKNDYLVFLVKVADK